MPEEYRDKIALLRSYGYGLKPKRVSKKSLGQAGFGTPVEKCDEAQADLDHRIEELENVKGVTQDEN